MPTGLGAVEPPPDLVELAEGLGVGFEPGDADRLGRYLALLLAANESLNLTAIRDPGEAWEKIVLDSLTLLPVLDQARAAGDKFRVLDVGSGGGVPGLVLACCLPGAEVMLLDATAKKCAFLVHAAEELGLSNVRVVCARAESAGQNRGRKADTGGESRREGALRESFDAVTARGVGRLATLLELVVPFARVGGLCLLTKGAKAEEELAEAKGALHLLHAAHAGTVETPTGRIVVIEKLRSTPRAYPREDGEPKRRPLGCG